MVLPSTDLTVAALVERDGQFLIVEETVRGKRVLTQPGGHIEPGESPVEAVRREAIEETGFEVQVRDLIGAYAWTDPDGGRDYLRIVFLADLESGEPANTTDPNIHAVHWCNYTELATHRHVLRSRSVIRCVDDYLAGARQPRSLFAEKLQPEQQVDLAFANAALLSA